MGTTERTAALPKLDAPAAFALFVEQTEPGLRRALVARLGETRGRDATVDALAYAWLHWERLAPMANPAGYLYRVAVRSASRTSARSLRFVSAARLPDTDPGDASHAPDYEPGLPAAIARLSANQRTAILLVHGWHYSQAEAAALLGMSESTLRTHLQRGLKRLRSELGGIR